MSLLGCHQLVLKLRSGTGFKTNQFGITVSWKLQGLPSIPFIKHWSAHRTIRKIHVHALYPAAPANHSHIDGETRRDACQPTRHYDDSGVGGNNRLNYVDLPQSVSFTSLHLQWYVLRFKMTNGTWRCCFLEPKSKKIWDSKCLQKCEFEWNTLWFADGGSMTGFAACRAINTGSSRRNRNRSVGRQQSHSLIADGSRSITFVRRRIAAVWYATLKLWYSQKTLRK